MNQQTITSGLSKPLPPSGQTKEFIPTPTTSTGSGSTITVVSVGGSVIANAGDDLNTSELALEDGNLKNLKDDQVEVRRFQERMYLQNYQYNILSMLSTERYSGNRGFEIR